MSNASNLSTLANVLDDGTSGQFLKSTGSGGVAFDTVAAGAVVYATADLLPLSGNSAGDMAYVTATNRFYINNGSGWYSVSLVNTNPNITSVQDAGSNTTPFTLATDGTATVVTVTAADPEEVPLTYGYSVTSGSLNGSTVAQGTGSNSNVFTVTPHASQDATFTLTFTASDGINQATSANAFSLSFVTGVDDSKYTALLATATGTSDNNNITDSSTANSGSGHNITVNGDAYAGTFSPYRSGGYLTSFEGSNDYLKTPSSDFYLSTGQFSVEVWIKPSDLSGNRLILIDTYYNLYTYNTQVKWWSNSVYTGNAGNFLSVGKWTHLLVTRDSNNTLRIFADGVLLQVVTNHTHDYGTSNTAFELSYSGGSGVKFVGEMRDARVISGSIPSDYQTSSTTTTSASAVITVPTEPLTAVSGTKLLACNQPYLVYTTASATGYFNTIGGNPSTKPSSPYDYEEYSATDHGGSVFINAQGDQISATTTAIGTSNFTLEAWIYPTAQGVYNAIDGYQSIWASNYNSNPGFAFYQNGTSINIWTVDSGGSNNRSTSGTIIENAWNHVVWQRNGTGTNNNKVFLNGVETDSFTDSTNFSNTSMLLGSHNSTGSGVYEFHGYISDARFSRNARYTSGNFIPPTTPLSSTNAELHIKGTDASIIDKAQGSNLKLYGTTTGSTGQAKFSNTKSIYFGSPGVGLSTSPPALDGEFTIECWVYFNSFSGGTFQTLFSQPQAVGSPTEISTRNNNNTIQVLFGGNTNQTVTAGWTTSINTWYHLAVVRDSNNTVAIYVDGSALSNVLFATQTLTLFGHTTDLYIGQYDIYNSYPFDGYMQDVRITKGLARYTANFTPPTAPLEG